MNNKENCKRVKGFKHYYVSQDGKFYSNKIAKYGFVRLSPPLNKDGRLYLNLMHSNGIQATYLAAMLVLETYVGSRPYRAHVCYRDGNYQNIAVTNLFWGTKEMKRSLQDKFAQEKVTARPERQTTIKPPATQARPGLVKRILYLHERGCTKVEIMAKLNLTHDAVTQVLNQHFPQIVETFF